MVEIKNPFGSFLYNPQADAWWVPPFFYENLEFLNTLIYIDREKCQIEILFQFQGVLNPLSAVLEKP